MQETDNGEFPNVTSIGDNAFYLCSALTTVDFPNVTSIGANAFKDCAKLTTADFPNVTSMEFYAFTQCYALTTVNFPNITSIEDDSFYLCTALTTADFPNVTNIKNAAFYGCKALTSFVLRKNSVCTLSSAYVFNNTPIKSGTGYIYVPSALVESYKTATNWTTYANQFRALESYTVDGTTTGELDPTKVNA